jgi:plastocyanin
MRKLLVLGLIAAAVAAIVVAPAATGAKRAPTVVQVKNNFFKPKFVTIDKGGKVKWVWRSGGTRKHNVKGPGFNSGIRKTGSYIRTFNNAGTFSVVCTLHLEDNTRMTVKVRK